MTSLFHQTKVTLMIGQLYCSLLVLVLVFCAQRSATAAAHRDSSPERGLSSFASMRLRGGSLGSYGYGYGRFGCGGGGGGGGGLGFPQCGGIAGIQCPVGLLCVDDPRDDCRPRTGGADCSGICIRGPGAGVAAPYYSIY